MTGKNTAVYGIYANRAHLEDAVERIRVAGFRNTDISVLFPDNAGTKDFAHEKHTKAPEGVTTGGTAGGLIGGTLGWLVGIGSIAVPGIGPFIAAGPILTALAGAGAGAAIGGLVGALVGMGIPEYEAKRYEGRIRAGGILLSVHCDNSDWVKRAKDLLHETGADDIGSAGEAGADFAEGERPAPRRYPQSAGVATEFDRDAEDDADYRQHYRQRYGSDISDYDSYAPAYALGRRCARECYGNWSECEVQARRDWESRTGRSWETVQDAVRYAWERARRLAA